jgi:hypothetical protein
MKKNKKNPLEQLLQARLPPKVATSLREKKR